MWLRETRGWLGEEKEGREEGNKSREDIQRRRGERGGGGGHLLGWTLEWSGSLRVDLCMFSGPGTGGCVCVHAWKYPSWLNLFGASVKLGSLSPYPFSSLSFLPFLLPSQHPYTTSHKAPHEHPPLHLSRKTRREGGKAEEKWARHQVIRDDGKAPEINGLVFVDGESGLI